MTRISKGRAYNATAFVLQSLAWIGCWVGFAGILFIATSKEFYWNRVVLYTRGGTAVHYFSDMRGEEFESCARNGKGMIGLLVMGFLSLSASLSLLFLRITGKAHVVFGAVEPTAKSVRAELIASTVSLALLFLAVVVWGAGCYARMRQAPAAVAAEVAPTGFVMLIFSLLFLLGALAMLDAIRHDPLTHVLFGDTATDSSPVAYTDMNPGEYRPPPKHSVAVPLTHTGTGSAADTDTVQASSPSPPMSHAHAHAPEDAV